MINRQEDYIPTKVLISQGQGRLHFSETCSSAFNAGVKVSMLTGWVPRGIPTKLIDFLGKLFNKTKLSKRLELRIPKGVPEDKIIRCPLPEFYYYSLVILAKLKLISIDTSLSKGWMFWGSQSKKYIKNIDIFHVRSGAGQGGAITLAKKRGIKTITDHSIAHPQAMKHFLFKEYQEFNMPFELDPDSEFWQMVINDCEQSDILLVNSNFVAETFIQYGFSEQKIKVLYLGVDESFFKLKTSWEVKSSLRLLFTGSFSIRKGAKVVLEALLLLKRQGISVVLDVVGYFDEVEILKSKYNIPDNIIFHGNVLQDEIKDFLKNSDIYIFPTLAEGSARSAMEAMAVGIPVITTENCGSPITHGEDGIIIQMNSAEDLVKQIINLAGDHQLREKLGKNASDLISTSYKWSDYGQNLKALYADMKFNNEK